MLKAFDTYLPVVVNNVTGRFNCFELYPTAAEENYFQVRISQYHSWQSKHLKRCENVTVSH